MEQGKIKLLHIFYLKGIIMKRISITVTDDKLIMLNKFAIWGLKNKLFNAIIDDLIRVCGTERGPEIITRIIQRQIDYTDLSSNLLEGVTNDSR